MKSYRRAGIVAGTLNHVNRGAGWCLLFASSHRRRTRVYLADDMTKDIIEKLRKHFAVGIRTERRVAYLLTEIRKMLEDEKPNPRPMALWMFCHWALHVNLSRSHTTSHFLHQIDTFTISKRIKGLPEAGWKILLYR